MDKQQFFVTAEKMANSIMRDHSPIISKKWQYDCGLTLLGIGALYEKTNKQEYFDYIKESMDYFINDDGTINTYNPTVYNIDHINNGKDCFEYVTRDNPDGKVDNSNHFNDLNAIAENLGTFVESVKKFGGYYLARYEASYGSGDGVANYKPLSKVSTGTPRTSSSTALTQGMLWNCITQLDAAKISRNMYSESDNVGVESDLVNSYAWDTAIVFIQEMENTNYANKKSVNTSLMNTGTIGDEVCNIHDMASNCWEWTTEYSTSTGSSLAHPCVCRGGSYSGSNRYTAYRGRNGATGKHSGYSFRLTLYVK